MKDNLFIVIARFLKEWWPILIAVILIYFVVSNFVIPFIMWKLLENSEIIHFPLPWRQWRAICRKCQRSFGLHMLYPPLLSPLILFRDSQIFLIWTIINSSTIIKTATTTSVIRMVNIILNTSAIFVLLM